MDHLSHREPRDRRGPRGRRWEDRRPALRPRVLIVEPHDDTRTLYSAILEEAGYAVFSVNNGADAVAVAQDRLPDVVVLEIVVPDLDGFAILQELRRMPTLSDIPTIVVTGMLHYGTPDRAREAGATIVFEKPTPIDLLLRAVDDVLRETPRARLAQRQLRRSLLTLRKLGAHLDGAAQDRIRALIDRLQVAVLAVDDQGRCVAASTGFTELTGYARDTLLTMSLSDAAFGPHQPLAKEWEAFVARQQDLADTTIRDGAGGALALHASFATISPGLHAAAFMAA